MKLRYDKIIKTLEETGNNDIARICMDPARQCVAAELPGLFR